MRYRSSLAMLAACAVFAAPIALAAGSGGSGSSAPPSQSNYDPTVDYQRGADAFASGKYDEAAKAFNKVVSASHARRRRSAYGWRRPKRSMRPMSPRSG